MARAGRRAGAALRDGGGRQGTHLVRRDGFRVGTVRGVRHQETGLLQQHTGERERPPHVLSPAGPGDLVWDRRGEHWAGQASLTPRGQGRVPDWDLFARSRAKSLTATTPLVRSSTVRYPNGESTRIRPVRP